MIKGDMVFARRLTGIICLGLLLGCNSEQSQPDRIKSIVIDVVGDDFNWYFRYPGMDGILGTGDDEHSVQDLFLPDNAEVKLKLNSNDYLYSFALPDLNLKEIAVPGLNYEIDFSTGSAKTLDLLGDQFCGYSHKSLIGKVRVRNQNGGFYGWGE